MEGLSRSRLPPLTADDIAFIKGTYDFFGLNHYSAYIVNNLPELPASDPSGITDRRVEVSYNPSWLGSNVFWLKVGTIYFIMTFLFKIVLGST